MKLIISSCSLIVSLVSFWGVSGINDFDIIGIERYESAIQLEHGSDPRQLQYIWNADIEERRKACVAAQNAFKINNYAYKPHRYRPELLQYNFLNPIQKADKSPRDFLDSRDSHSSDEEEDEDDEHVQSSAHFGTFAMYCGTLPSVYVRISLSQSENLYTKYLKAILIEPAFDPFQIRRQNEKPKAIFHDHSKEAFGDNPLVELNLEDRRGLCITANENHSFTFFSSHVPEARTYELKYSPGKKEIVMGVRCPVVPPLILHQEDRLSLLNLTFIEIPVDEYTYKGFEIIVMSGYARNQEQLKSIHSWDYQTGWSFCTFAQRHFPASKRNLFTIDNSRIGVARVYNFIHPDGTKANFVAVQCTEAPTIFVYLIESKKEVKTLVFSSTADKLNEPDPEPSTSLQSLQQLRILTTNEDNTNM